MQKVLRAKGHRKIYALGLRITTVGPNDGNGLFTHFMFANGRDGRPDGDGFHVTDAGMGCLQLGDLIGVDANLQVGGDGALQGLRPQTMLLCKAAQGRELIRMEPPGGNPQTTEIAELGSADQRCAGERLRTTVIVAELIVSYIGLQVMILMTAAAALKPNDAVLGPLTTSI